MIYTGEPLFRTWKFWNKLEPEEELFYRLEFNPVWPFVKIAPGIFYLTVRSDRSVYGFAVVFSSVLCFILMYAMLGFVSLINATFLIIFICGIWAVLGNGAWREVIICRMKGKGFYLLRVFRNQQVLIQGEIKNVYIRLEKREGSPLDVFYFLTVGGFYLDEHRLTRMSNNRNLLELMGRIIARRIGINFFTDADVSYDHRVWHFPQHSLLSYNEEAKILYAHRARKKERQQQKQEKQITKMASHEKEWMIRKKALWDKYNPNQEFPQEDGKPDDQHLVQPTTTFSVLEHYRPKGQKKHVWAYKKIGNEWKKVRFHVKLRDWDNKDVSSGSDDSEGPPLIKRKTQSAHELGISSKKKTDLLTKKKRGKDEEIIVYKLKWNRAKVIQGKKWKPTKSQQELSYGAKRYDKYMRRRMIPLKKNFEIWTANAKKRFGISTRKKTNNLNEIEYYDDDSVGDLSSISSRFSLPSMVSMQVDKDAKKAARGKKRSNSAHAALNISQNQQEKSRKSKEKTSLPPPTLALPVPKGNEGSAHFIHPPKK